ncbi:MAG TPA: hypothetical protein VE078_08840, partial [Thermoanaerobaculia bacterium]|nr:hypothetical protein [Thermoanaerobaculia bacterium]
RRFIEAVRSESLLTDLAMEEGPAESPGFEPAVFGSASPAALQWEVDQLSAEAGRVVSRLTRAMLVLMSRTGQRSIEERG